MTFVVTARIRGPGTGSNAPRITSRRFKTRRKAQSFADATNRDRPGSNARVKNV